MEDAVDHFMAFTGAGTDVARRYLGLTENNSEQAIQLFFDSPELASGLDQQPTPSAPPVPTSTRPQTSSASAGQGTSKDAIEIGSDDDENMDLDDDDNEEEAAE